MEQAAGLRKESTGLKMKGCWLKILRSLLEALES
jgi:hypothetical protein